MNGPRTFPRRIAVSGSLIWFVTANNAWRVAPECPRRRICKARALLNSRSFPGFSEKPFQLLGNNRGWATAIAHRGPGDVAGWSSTEGSGWSMLASGA